MLHNVNSIEHSNFSKVGSAFTFSYVKKKKKKDCTSENTNYICINHKHNTWLGLFYYA